MTLTEINKSTIISNIYKNFYTLVNAITQLENKVYPESHYHLIDDSADYPIIIINSPNISWSPFTFGKGVCEGTIVIDIFEDNPKDCDLNADRVSDKIETSKGTLAGLGLRQINLTDTNKDVIPQGKIQVHMKSLTFNYKFYFTKTVAY